MTVEKLWKAEELRDRIEALGKKLFDLSEMQNKASDCAKNSELLVSVGTRSNMSSMFIDTDAVMLMLKEAEAWYTEKKHDVEEEFDRL